jgi:small subunit ribosomal protein S15
MRWFSSSSPSSSSSSSSSSDPVDDSEAAQFYPIDEAAEARARKEDRRTRVQGGKLAANVVSQREFEFDLSGIEDGQMMLGEELQAALAANELSAEEAEAMKRVLSYRTASQEELMNQRIQNLIVQYRTHEGDSGSAGVVIAVLSEKIANVERHLGVHTKDVHSKRVLSKYLHRRRALLKYLRHRNAEGAVLYEKLLLDFNIDRAWLNNYGRIEGRQVFTTPSF